MPRSSLLARATAAAALFILPIASASAAQAAPQRSSEQIALSVYTAANPEAAFNSLSPAEQKTFAARMKTWTSTETFSGQAVPSPPTPAEQKAMTAASTRATTSTAAVAAGGSGCWSQYKYYTWKDLNISTGNTWMTARWCSQLLNITTYSLTGQGGQGNVGVQYDGLGIRPTNRTNYEVRQGQVFKFHIGSAHAEPCMQIRGNAGGGYSFRADCNLS
ncbi:MAG: hypothetical protein EOO60_08305 [Hymenobacter sp.]|nr:MAG: hypothetical protein EOO60_08305 [Hymenobacter sp.]